MKKTILILATILMLTSCSKNDDTPAIPEDQLPAITATGANTAGCLINGKVLIPKNGINSLSGSTSNGLETSRGVNFNNAPYGGDYFSMKFANLNDKGKNYWIYIHLNNLTTGIGAYTVGQSNGEFFNLASNNPQIIVRETLDNVSGKTFISGVNSGSINITRFDFNTLYNSIISGTFNAILYNKDNSEEKIQVTEGRFDLKI
jgi:hypothetical protein